MAFVSWNGIGVNHQSMFSRLSGTTCTCNNPVTRSPFSNAWNQCIHVAMPNVVNQQTDLVQAKWTKSGWCYTPCTQMIILIGRRVHFGSSRRVLTACQQVHYSHRPFTCNEFVLYYDSGLVDLSIDSCILFSPIHPITLDQLHSFYPFLCGRFGYNSGLNLSTDVRK